MAATKKSAVARYRHKAKKGGLMRLEVMVRREDAPLLRRVASALADPEHRTEARLRLSGEFAPPAGKGLKALLAAAPLEGIDLERARDMGRDVDL